MRAPLTWLREYAALPEDLDARELGERLIEVGLEVETVERAGSDVSGPVVVGRVLSLQAEPQKNGKTINWCRVDVGEHNPDPAQDEPGRGIVCGAHNFGAGDLVVVALPGAVLGGDFAIAARKTYGHVSDGMICSSAELGLGADHDGILVLAPTADDGHPLQPGEDAAAILGLRDEVLDIAVTPDMGYCFSIRGLAREAAAACGVAFTDPVDRPVPAPVADGYPVRLDSDGCPVFTAVTVTGLDPSRPSPQWLIRRLQLAGMRSISLAVDITNYVMLETGQPLHGYDADALRGPIVVRRAHHGEQIVTLDDVTRDLEVADLVIADDSGVIGIAGTMGGASTEIGAETTSVVVEAACFEALSVARTSRRHRLSSEASRRFERGVDPSAGYAAAHRAAQLLVELAGGSVSSETVVGAVPEASITRIPADLAERILGTPVSTQRAVALLEAGGTGVRTDGRWLELTPPSWRPDLTDPYDYVHEMGRRVGLDTIVPVLPLAPAGRGLSRSQRARRAVNAALVGAGLVEALSLPFSCAEDLDRLQVPAEDARRRLVRLANPLADTAPFLRSTLLPGLIAAAGRNLSRGLVDLALFETGSVFYATDGAGAPQPGVDRRPSDAELAALEASLPDQPRHLAVLLCGQWRAGGWQGPAEPAGWPHALAAADCAAAALGVRLTREAVESAPWHPGRCAALSVNGQRVGFAGELHPSVSAAFGLPARSAAVELDLDALIAAAPAAGAVAPISSWPLAKEDVALVVDETVPVAEVEAALREGAGELLESLRLFDIYTGEQVPDGSRSLAFALRLRATDRTLTDAEAGAARDAAVAVAAERWGARLRA